MKLWKKAISLVALAVVMTLLCTGCGLLSLVGSVGKKNGTDTTAAGDLVSTVPDAQPSEQIGFAEGDGSTVTLTPSAQDTGSGVASVPTTVRQASDTVPSTKKPAGTQTATKPAASAPAQTTEVDLSNLSVKEIQDLLFDTKDPNVAGKIMTIAGFDYDAEQGIYYSTVNPLQRYFGFNIIYDIAAPRTGMVYSTSRVYFDYNNKNWMIQIWKGQYGITAGGEIGVYNKPADRALAHYDCASDDEMLVMSFDFYNNNKYVFSRGPEKHWWLTGFKVFEVGVGILIDLDMNIQFPNREMADAFEGGLKKAIKNELVDKMTYKRSKNNFNIKW